MHDDLEPWLTAFATPLFDHDGQVMATLVTSGLSLGITGKLVDELGRIRAAEAATGFD
jgi:DNA-binding IclR family transcriptional regulator